MLSFVQTVKGVAQDACNLFLVIVHIATNRQDSSLSSLNSGKAIEQAERRDKDSKRAIVKANLSDYLKKNFDLTAPTLVRIFTEKTDELSAAGSAESKTSLKDIECKVTRDSSSAGDNKAKLSKNQKRKLKDGSVSNEKMVNCSGCKKQGLESSMGCPTCEQLGLPSAYFCSQSCFEFHWKEHRKLHKEYKAVLLEQQKREQQKEEPPQFKKAKKPSGIEITDGTGVNAKVIQSKKKYEQIDNPSLNRGLFPPNYMFTGNLRPWPCTYPQRMPQELPIDVNLTTDYSYTGVPLSERKQNRSGSIPIVVKDSEDYNQLKEACRLARMCLDEAGRAVMNSYNTKADGKNAPCTGIPGTTTPEHIDQIVHSFAMRYNSYPSPLNYRNFPRSVCVSVNEVICHGIPDSRPFQRGDIVNVDVTLFYKGFHADLNETYLVPVEEGTDPNTPGKDCWFSTGSSGFSTGSSGFSTGSSGFSAGSVVPIEKSPKPIPSLNDRIRLVKGTYEALMEAIAMVKPGILYREIGQAIARVAKKYNLSIVRSYCGHGIGKDLFHCAPNIPHYAPNKAVGVVKEGHVFTIEPMLNLGSHHDTMWPDNWTVVTRDGSYSAQFEHTMIVTKTGVEILTGRIGRGINGFDHKSSDVDPNLISPLGGWESNSPIFYDTTSNMDLISD